MEVEVHHRLTDLVTAKSVTTSPKAKTVDADAYPPVRLTNIDIGLVVCTA